MPEQKAGLASPGVLGFRQDVPCCQQAWVYVLAQLAGGLLSAAFSFPLYGLGADWARLWDRSSLRPHLHRRHHSRGTGSKCATPKDPTLEVRSQTHVTSFGYPVQRRSCHIRASNSAIWQPSESLR